MMKMNKICNGCAALDVTQCMLGFQTQCVPRKVGNMIFHEMKPAERCPKPKSYKLYVKCMKHPDKNKNRQPY